MYNSDWLDTMLSNAMFTLTSVNVIILLFKMIRNPKNDLSKNFFGSSGNKEGGSNSYHGRPQVRLGSMSRSYKSWQYCECTGLGAVMILTS